MLIRSFLFFLIGTGFVIQLNAEPLKVIEGNALPVSERELAEHRAKFNYQMFCQGCHSADGSGHKSVPELKGFMHKFMASQQGREYLVRVPGAANSSLNNQELAEVMNWMLHQFGDHLALSWRPYEALEVGVYRQHPLNETIKYREKLIANLEQEANL